MPWNALGDMVWVRAASTSVWSSSTATAKSSCCRGKRAATICFPVLRGFLGGALFRRGGKGGSAEDRQDRPGLPSWSTDHRAGPRALAWCGKPAKSGSCSDRPRSRCRPDWFGVFPGGWTLPVAGGLLAFLDLRLGLGLTLPWGVWTVARANPAAGLCLAAPLLLAFPYVIGKGSQPALLPLSCSRSVSAGPGLQSRPACRLALGACCRGVSWGRRLLAASGPKPLRSGILVGFAPGDDRMAAASLRRLLGRRGCRPGQGPAVGSSPPFGSNGRPCRIPSWPLGSLPASRFMAVPAFLADETPTAGPGSRQVAENSPGPLDLLEVALN